MGIVKSTGQSFISFTFSDILMYFFFFSIINGNITFIHIGNIFIEFLTVKNKKKIYSYIQIVCFLNKKIFTPK